MKALIQTAFGPPDVLRLVDLAKPVPKEKEVLIRVRAAAVNALDWRVMRGTPFPARLMAGGLRRPKPRPIGVDVAGEIEAVGKGVTEFQPGDAVFGACRGAFAEYVCVAAKRLVAKPANVSFEEAAGVPIAAMSALQGLRDKARVERGHEVLVDGASGGVGTFAIQIAKWLGARVTASCSPGKMEQARSLGADHVIDYTRVDFTQTGHQYDRILGANSHRSVYDYRRALRPAGIYAVVGGGGQELLQSLLVAPFYYRLEKRKMTFVLAKFRRADLVLLARLLASGEIVTAIDRRYRLDQAVEALRYVERGHASGKVIITMGPEGGA